MRYTTDNTDPTPASTLYTAAVTFPSGTASKWKTFKNNYIASDITTFNPPTAIAQSASVTEDVPRTITLTGSSPENKPLSFTIVSAPAKGTVSGGTGPTRTYTPNPDANGSDGFIFKVNDGLIDSAPATVTLTIAPVNDAPAFTKGADLSAAADSGAHTIAAWATGISVGPADESGQTLSFQVSNDNASLFTVQPIVAANGTLTFTPATTASGSASVTVALHDDGGTANSGSDSSPPQTFTITTTNQAAAESVARWLLDEAYGTILQDASGHRHDGQISGSPDWTIGPEGLALTFDGLDDVVTIPDSPDLRLTGDMSLSFWLKPRTYPATLVPVVAKGSNGAPDQEYGLWIEASVHRLAFQQLNAGLPCVSLSSQDPIPLKRWTHVAVTVSGAQVTLYINGVEDASATRDGPPATSTEPVCLGHPGPFTGFQGVLDRVQLDNRALSVAEIQTLANRTNQPPVANAGPDRDVIAGAQITLVGNALDDGIPGDDLSFQWTQSAGPVNLIFSSPERSLTDVTFPSVGVYRVSLEANDSELSSTDEVVFTVIASVDSDGDGLPDAIDDEPATPDTTAPDFQITAPAEGAPEIP